MSRSLRTRTRLSRHRGSTAGLSSVCRSVRDGFVEQQGGDCLRVLPHRVVGGGEVVDLPIGVSLESGAELSEGRVPLPSGAVDEVAPRNLSYGAGEPDRLEQRGERMVTAAGIAAVRPAWA